MTDYAKLNAIEEADKIVDSLVYKEQTYVNNDPEIRLLGFCLYKLGIRNQAIHSIGNQGIDELLNQNNVHHRRINLGRNLGILEYPLLIVFESATNLPLAFYRAGRRNWLYNPYTEDHIPAHNNLQLAEMAYEIYASLPARIEKPVEVFKFAFTQEISAILALLLTSLIVMLFNLSVPVLTNILVSRILPHNDRQLLLEGLGILLLIVTGSVSAQYLQNRMMLRIESVADLRLQSAVWDRILRLPMNFINKFTTGDLSSRANAINQLGQQLGSGVLTTVLASIFAISYFVLMYLYDARLALWASAFSALGLISTFILAARLVEKQVPLQEKGAEIVNFSMQTIMGLSQIRSAAAEPFVLLQWLRKINSYATIEMQNNFFSDAIEQYATLVSPISSLLIFASITNRLLNASSDVETTTIIVSYVSFNAAYTSFNGAITNAMNILANTLGQAFVLWKRAEPVICVETEPGYLPEAVEHVLVGNFEFRNVNYIHENNHESIFSNLNIVIAPGKHTIITGPSGCGKTTLLRMLLGFIYPETGDIIVDGIPLKNIAIRSYRRQMGVVMQNARLSGGSIYDLICCGGLYSEEEVWSALELASMASDVRNMPMQLETLVNDSGSTLSGGQIQRLAIARALITKPKVLLMDEATSALDNYSQQKITDSIRNLGITRISVAHRLATMRMADTIVIINNNKAIESGTWQEIKSSNYFKQISAKGLPNL